MNIYVCISGRYSDQSIDEIHTTKNGCLKWVIDNHSDLATGKDKELVQFHQWDGIGVIYFRNGYIEVCELTDDSPKFLTPVTP
jgi:hypothetical protein